MATEPDSNPIRVLLVGEDPFLLRGLGEVLEGAESAEVVGELCTSNATARAIRKTGADVAVLDWQSQGEVGFEQIAELSEELAVVALGVDRSAPLVEGLLRRGALGYVLREADSEEDLVEAVRTAAGGRIFVSHGLCSDLITLGYQGHEGSPSVLQQLSSREMDVFVLCGKGYSVQQIADRLHRSPKTIYTHRLAIQEKLGCGSPEELVHQATQWLEAGGSDPGLQ